MNDLVPPKGTTTIDAEDLSEAAEAVEATRVGQDVDPANDPEATPEQPVIDEQQAAMLMQTFAEEQNLLVGTISGLLAALVGAGIWAGVTIATEYQIGWMAVGIGFLVGLAMRYGGKGIAPIFGWTAAVLSMFGCVVGNILTYTWYIADMEGMAFMDVLSQLNLAVVVGLLTSTFAAIDLLFYGLAVYFGYKTAFRQVTQADLDRVAGKGF